MGRRRRSELAEIERQSGESEPGGSLVDMRLDFVHGADRILSVGGRWDDAERCFDGDAATGSVVRIHAGQLRAVEWFKTWLAVHMGRRDDPPAPLEDDDDTIDMDPASVYSALFAGGRRGGKTWIAAAICVAYAIQFPGAIVWAVSPSRGKDDTKPDEIRRYISRLLAAAWIARQTAATGWELVNGSVIALKSAYVGADPDAIKEGEVHLAWLNEAQKMKRRVYNVARAAIADKSGLVLCCANPPQEAKDEQWVTDFAADAEAGRRASVYLNFDPRRNPHINRVALQSMRAELDERAYAIEILGEFRAPVDAVAYNWIRTENERPVPAPGGKLRDCTEEFMRAIEEGDGITTVLGLDVQRIPYIGGPVYRFFCRAGESATRENVEAQIVGEIVLPGGDELDYCAAARDFGLDPQQTLIICDASGEYQHSRRRAADSPPPEWTGRGSFSLIRGEGFRRIVPPSRRSKKNPEIQDRIRSFTSMICNSLGRRRLFADRQLAPQTCVAIREWKQVHGKVSRTNDVAHLGDGVSYPLIRLFPRILRSVTSGGVDPVAKRVDRDAPRDPLGSPPIEPPVRRGARGDGVF